jgi:diguanylate cyclase (GGDEF)-like protein
VAELAPFVSIVVRMTLATLVTLMAVRMGERALLGWAVAWWLAVTASFGSTLDPWGWLAAGGALLLAGLSWRSWLSASSWARASALLGFILLGASRVAEGLLAVDREAALAGRLAGEVLIAFGVVLAPVERARSEAAAAQRRMAESERRLHRLVTWDPLTECCTRPVFRDLVDQVRVSQGVEHGAILVIDMDNLKRINDQAGHSAGDKAIRRTGLAIKRRLGENDLALRWGGDEFVAVLRGSDLQAARQMRHRIMAAVRREGLSVSVGLAVFGRNNDIVHALREADARMYAMKRRRQGARPPVPRQLALPLGPAEPARAALPGEAPARA